MTTTGALDTGSAIGNLGLKMLRRVLTLHKPLVRLSRRQARRRHQDSLVQRAHEIDRQLARLAAGRHTIVAGPWLAEVGYEVLYWIPFLRWFQDFYRIPPERLIAVSRGGVEQWYDGMAGRYVDLFDSFTPGELASRNAARQEEERDGSRKQSIVAALDEEILARVRAQAGLPRADVCHPSALFGLFREVWHGALPLDFFWSRTSFIRLPLPPRPDLAGLPDEYIAVKFYAGEAVADTAAHRAALRTLVRQASRRAPVVVLDTGIEVDDHRDYVFDDMPDVISASRWMTPRNNLGLQSALIAHSRQFVGTCGGLAWMAPFLGVPTVAVYADDKFLAPHLFVERQAIRRVQQAATFTTIDLRALDGLSEALSDR